MDMRLSPITWIILVVFVLSTLYFRGRKYPKFPLPPSPKNLALIKKLMDLGSNFDGEAAANLGKECTSDILHISVPGFVIVVLNSVGTAKELFDKRFAVYSSRTTTIMIYELVGSNWFLPAMPYGGAWRESETARNTVCTSIIGPGTGLPRIIARAIMTLSAIGGIVISLAYGLEIKPRDDPYIKLSQDALAGFMESTQPYPFLVNLIPILKYAPEFFPGGEFHTRARHRRKLQEVHNRPFKDAIKNLNNGTAQPSLVSMVLEGSSKNLNDDTGDKHNVVKDTAASFFAAGSDTTVGAIGKYMKNLIFLLVVLPNFDDKPRLQYLTAVIMEAFRWKPVVPFGVPHQVTKDDIYEGYCIPEGTTVIGNAWAMLQNERDYPNPSKFIPERFFKDGKLNPDVPNPLDISFGFGRRICPGRDITRTSQWLLITCVLAVFDITKPLNEDRLPINPKLEFLLGPVCHPTPYQCLLKVRDKEAEALIGATTESIA